MPNLFAIAARLSSVQHPTRWLRSALIASALVASTPLLAQESKFTDTAEKNEAIAKRWHRMAVTAYADGKYEAAIRAFERANQAHPNAAFSYNVARAYQALGDYAQAVNWYRNYLTRARHPRDAERVQHRIELLLVSLAKTRPQQLSVASDPDGAEVRVDGALVGVSPWKGSLSLGAHTLTLQKAGYEGVTKDFALSRDNALEVQIDLTRAATRASPAASAPTPVHAAAAAPRAHARSRQQRGAKPHSGNSAVKTLGIVVVASGVAGLGGALTFEVLRRSAVDDARRETVQLEYARDLDLVQSRQLASRVFLAVGAGLTVAGVLMVIVAANAHTDRDAPKAANTSLALGCSPTGCNVSMRGSY